MPVMTKITVRNFWLKKKTFFFSVKSEMPILFFVNGERSVLFSVERDQDPLSPPCWTVSAIVVMCNLCYMYIYSDMKIQENVENEQTIFVLSGLQWKQHAIDDHVGKYQ